MSIRRGCPSATWGPGLHTHSPLHAGGTTDTPLRPKQTLKLLNQEWGHAGWFLLNPESLQVAAVFSWSWGPD